ncbi:RNA pseudouridine synthase superfamily protein [Acanthamoeba castellanii str. Neff]|uniref:RNA pseudouridine synthase superfamily protein n=1 Tax=Acanthamoeba castellanii (strain ATCC 30010 / Neff) TaxID=1257118 RepID=L8GFU7_ACACF|nr:RNA pseudouridine synthase superfamily protein [Acanthamoeba castellanii str. Neff]ELR11734.1 RNA pseudouridine synthase superfamily protein [Acanthamoeba castellanii str. Neff]
MKVNRFVEWSYRQRSTTSSSLPRGEKELFYLLYHKPRGVECTTDPRIACSWVNLIDLTPVPPQPTASSSSSPSSSSSTTSFPSHAKHQLISVGRLDKDSEGLLLLTTDSSIVNPLMQSAGGYEKEYEVLLNRPFDSSPPSSSSTTSTTSTTSAAGGGFIARMRRGEAIRRGTVAILPPVAVEPIERPDSSERASYRGADEEADASCHLSANQRMKKARKERKKTARRRRKLVESATTKNEDDENSEDEGEDENGDKQKKKRKRGESHGDETTMSDKKRKTSGSEEEEDDGGDDQEEGGEEEEDNDEDGGEGTRWFRIVLREGKNRQIRRMVRVCSDRNLIVRRLIRVRLGALGMAGVTAPGSWRHLTPDEVAAIKRQCLPSQASSS